MARRPLTRVLCAVLVTAVAVAPSVNAFAQRSPPAPMTRATADVHSFLTDSPWSGSARLRYTKMDGRARPITRTARVSWASAPPVRQAITQYYRSKDGWDGFLPHLERMLARPFPAYIVMVRLTGQSIDRDRHSKQLQWMQAETELRRKDKPPLKAVSVEAWNDTGPANSHDMLLLYSFHASDPITLADREVMFSTRICGLFWVPGTSTEGCSYDITRTFRLKDMVIDGRLVL